MGARVCRFGVVRRVPPPSLLALLLVLGVAVRAPAAVPWIDPALLSGDEAALAITTKPALRYEAAGTATAPFSEMVRVFASTSLLADIQVEYERLLPEGETPEFTIEQTGPTAYGYVNREDETSTIREIRRHEAADYVEVVYHASGERFFGRFDAVIHIRVAPETDDAVAYTARVLAYPASRFLRVLARFPLVDLYFQRKTREVAGLSVRIGEALCARRDVSRATVPGPETTFLQPLEL